jgi:hypothetical protein
LSVFEYHSYDPERESTLNYTSSEVHSHSVDYVIGAYRDVFCKKNKIFYEAQVKRLKLPKKESEKLKILFHFKGWSPKFDEWIEAGSDRIRYDENICLVWLVTTFLLVINCNVLIATAILC